MSYVILTIFLIVVLVVVFAQGIARTTIFQYERGLRYGNGKFLSELGPGIYWYVPFTTRIVKYDIRQQATSVTGQEVLSADGVTLKVSIAACFEIADLNVAVNKVQDFQMALHLELQLGLREIIGAADIETVLANRAEISAKLFTLAKPKADALGLKLNSVSIKDIMFPGKLKEMFAQVVSAKKEGMAALERARGETAALRNLANAAKMVDDNPNLLHLRTLQSIGGTSGNTIVLGMPPQQIPIPIANARGKSDSPLSDASDDNPDANDA